MRYSPNFHRDTYRIVLDDAYGFALVSYSGSTGPETFVARTLARLREIVAELRDTGAVPAARATYRALFASARSFPPLTVWRSWDATAPDADSHEWPSRWSFSDGEEFHPDRHSKADPKRCIALIAHCHSNSMGDALYASVNADALQELANDNSGSHGNGEGGLGWVNGSLGVNIDAVAVPEVAEAILGLAEYPIIDDDAVSEAEMERDNEYWERDGVRVAESRLESIECLNLDNVDLHVHVDLSRVSANEFTGEIQGLAWEKSTSHGEGMFDNDVQEAVDEIAKGLGNYGLALALLEADAIRSFDGEQSIRDMIPNNADPAMVLADIGGNPEDPAHVALADALAYLASGAVDHPELPFPAVE